MFFKNGTRENSPPSRLCQSAALGPSRAPSSTRLRELRRKRGEPDAIVAAVLRFLVTTTIAFGVTSSAAAQERFLHFGTKAAAMGGAFTAVANDATAFYWNPAGYAFGPAAHAGFHWGESRRNRGEGNTLGDEAAGFSLGLTFMGVAGTFSKESSSRLEDDVLSSRGLETFDFSVSILQSLPIDDLVIAGNVHYLRRESHDLFEAKASLSPGEQTPSAIRNRVLATEGDVSSTASVDLGALYQPHEWLRLGLMWRRLFEPAFRLPSGEEIVLPRHGRAGVAFFLPRATTLSFDFDLSSQGSVDEDWRELSLGVDKRLFDDALSLRAGLRAETGSGRGARPAFSAGLGLRIRFVVVELAYQGSSEMRDEALWFGVSVSP